MTQFVFTNAAGKIVTIKNPDTNTQNLDIDLSKIVVADDAGNILAKDLSFKKSPINITSWSYVGTTITLNVASHTFVAGDFIEVIGLTSSTYPANGIQLVTSVTSTTIVFTLGATPTGTAGVSSATVKGYATINGRVSESIGVNQTWQDVTASRVAGTTYTNSTGKPIFVRLEFDLAVGGAIAYIIINGLSGGNAAANSTRGSISFIVPNGSTYSYAGTCLIAKWHELR